MLHFQWLFELPLTPFKQPQSYGLPITTRKVDMKRERETDFVFPPDMFIDDITPNTTLVTSNTTVSRRYIVTQTLTPFRTI